MPSTPPAPLTHTNDDGEVHMVDVGTKAPTQRRARARATVEMLPTTAQAIRDETLKKGDVLAVARVAGIMAAKRTSELVPLCHPIALTHVRVALEVREDRVTIETETRCQGPTGVEMEALTAASVAALTVYDMAKAVDRGMRITGVELLSKEGGKSGRWVRDEPPGP